MKSMSYWNIFVSAFFSVLGIMIIFLSKGFPVNPGTGDPGSGFWPVSLGIIMILLSVILFFQSLISKGIRGKVLSMATDAHKKVYVVMGLSVLFCICTYFLGFIVASFLFIYLLMSVLGVSCIKEKTLTALLIIAALYLIFTVILKTTLPLPVFLR